MNTRKKWIVTALILLGAGVLLCGIAYAATGFDAQKLSSASYETNTYEVNESFRDILVESITDDIAFAPSEDGKCSVVCREKDDRRHEVKVENDTLKISADNSQSWFDFFDFSFQGPTVTVYLPESQYGALSIDVSTGDIHLPEDLTFDEIKIDVITGDVACSSSSEGSMEIVAKTGNIVVDGSDAGQMTLSVTTGDIRAANAACDGMMDVHVTTGDTRLDNVTSGSIHATGTTGDLVMKNALASEAFELERSTGDILFDSCDAGSIAAKATTGDISGTLRSDKIFVTHTNTGDVNVPGTTTGGKCELSTSTGDIDIDIVK